MEELKKAALDTIEENKELIASVADQIWEYAELSLQEVRSAALYCKILKELGFAVEEGVCSISAGRQYQKAGTDPRWDRPWLRT